MPVTARDGAPYLLNVPVDEVKITFQALNEKNTPVTDLKAEEMDVFDNGRGPETVLRLQRLEDRPIHAAFVIDTSGSVASRVSSSRVYAQQAVDKLLTRSEDEGSALSFGRSRHLVQNWTTQKETLKESIDRIGRHPQELSDGTSLFDTLFSTCFAQFERDNALAAVHVILLFSDGEDTASFGTDEKKAMDKCRENHVLIYAFNPKQASEPTSTGLFTLRQFADESGGRMFYLDGGGDDVTADISTMAADLRQGYLLFYRPRGMRQDGSFHRVVVVGPKRVASIVGTSGFYAPTR